VIETRHGNVELGRELGSAVWCPKASQQWSSDAMHHLVERFGRREFDDLRQWRAIREIAPRSSVVTHAEEPMFRFPEYLIQLT
jgi:hypothetical protein